jgi:S1-C subfamily serine protease
MQKLKGVIRTPFASALAGGLVVALLGWVAIAAGWVDGGDSTVATAPAAVPLATPAADNGSGDGETVGQIYKAASPGVAYIEAQRAAPRASEFSPFGPPGGGGGTATGSGFVIDDQGRIITNAHVVDGSDDITVKLSEDGDTYDAKLLGEDPSTDIAVLQIDAPGDALHPISLGDSTQVSVGDPVVAIGNPFGLDHTATAGIVSAVQREIDSPNGFVIRDAIQTDAPINPGNSGGPLLDGAGRVIGVNSQIESPDGRGNVGIGFAVPINTAHEVADQLIEKGEVQHAYVGISGTDLTPRIADVLNIDADGGAIVESVVPDSPADKAGIEAGDSQITIDGQPLKVGGDVIVAADGKPVDSMSDVIAAVDSKQPGDELQLTLLHGGDQRDVTVELAERPATAKP